ncbi:MAG: hypothetical protein J2P26_07895, partial [Nocardiopsaceae bacterium]|nr:hypothetical protein [Nocardiopsaceae bacterium]
RSVPASAGGWEPRTWLGAPAPGGLALPPAQPSASWLYAPRGAFLGTYRGREVLVAADTGNHRVMIWHSVPERDETPCDVVLGQPDFTSEGPACGCGDTRRGMYLPTGVLIHDDLLIVGDAWHHRVLVYNGLPETSGAEPDLVLGQDGLGGVEPNRAGRSAGAGWSGKEGEPSASSFYWPFGVAVVGGRFYVADTGNRRVLGWSGGVPSSPSAEPDLVLGQPDEASREENRGGEPTGSSFRWPHALCGTGQTLLIADAGNHRVLGWSPHPDKDTAANLVLGQPGFDTAVEMPYSPQSGETMRFPYAVDNDVASGGVVSGGDGGRLAVADTANNRILLWDGLPSQDKRAPSAVLAQPSFSANGENRWAGVTRDSLCWPYGLSLRGDRLAVADSGNNRIMIWGRS